MLRKMAALSAASLRFRCTHCSTAYATYTAVHYAFDKPFCSTFCRYAWLRDWEQAAPIPPSPNSFAARLYTWIKERDTGGDT